MKPELMECQCGHHAREHDRETWRCDAKDCTKCDGFCVAARTPNYAHGPACVRCGHSESAHWTDRSGSRTAEGRNSARCAVEGCGCDRLVSCLWPEGRRLVAEELDDQRPRDAPGSPAGGRVVVTCEYGGVGGWQEQERVMRLALELYGDVVAGWGEPGARVLIEHSTWRVEVSRRPPA